MGISGGQNRQRRNRQRSSNSELYEETHQRNEQLEFRGLFRVEDAKGQIKYQAIFTCQQEELISFEHTEDDEMAEIRLWDMQEDIVYVDECDVKIVQMLCN